MASFFEKLKKGMGIKIPAEEKVEKETEEKRIKQIRRVKIKKPPKESKLPTPTVERSSLGGKTGQAKKLEVKTLTIIEKEPKKEIKEEIEEKVEIKEKEPSFAKVSLEPQEGPPLEQKITTKDKEKWFEPEGQLAIDVYQTENDLVIQSAIAGVKPESLDIVIERDVITIKGSREKPFEENGDYFSQECFWGSFSREVILPAEVDPERVEASMRDGVLTIRMPKILREKKRKIIVKE